MTLQTLMMLFVCERLVEMWESGKRGAGDGGGKREREGGREESKCEGWRTGMSHLHGLCLDWLRWKVQSKVKPEARFEKQDRRIR